jgi:penicillin-binding protein 1A
MSRRERQRRRRRNEGSASRVIFVFLGLVVTGVAIAGVAAVAWVINVANSAPSLDTRKPIELGATSRIYAADGKTRLAFINANILRTPVHSARSPTSCARRRSPIEDRRFYEHQGVDFEGIVRAAIKNVESKKDIQGGSTLTMQLVRNLYTGERARSGVAGYKRKIREAKLAQELEDRHPGRPGKLWIVNKYVNSVPYGTVGGQTAVGHPGRRARLLRQAGLAPDAARGRAAGRPAAGPVELQPVPRQGRGHRAAQRRAAADGRPGLHHPGHGDQDDGPGPRRQAQPLLHVPARGLRHRLRQAVPGRQVRRRHRAPGRAADRHHHRPASAEARAPVDGRPARRARPRRRDRHHRPEDRLRRAMASSSRYGDSKFNLAASGHRQAGSTFKVMVLMDALRRGVDPNRTTYVSKHLSPGWLPAAPSYEVQTYSHSYGGSMNLVKATLQSDNSVYAQLDADLGAESVAKTARDMGITSPLHGYPAEGLGGLTDGVSPLEMARAYASIANGGYRVKPIVVRKVTFPNGHVDNLGKPSRTRSSRRRRLRGDQDPQQERAGRDGHRGADRLPGGGQDRHRSTTTPTPGSWASRRGWSPRSGSGIPRTLSARSRRGRAAWWQAPIWGRYMKSAHGKFCGDFPQPKVPFVAQPFFGKYSRTGARTAPPTSSSPA